MIHGANLITSSPKSWKTIQWLHSRAPIYCTWSCQSCLHSDEVSTITSARMIRRFHQWQWRNWGQHALRWETRKPLGLTVSLASCLKRLSGRHRCSSRYTTGVCRKWLSLPSRSSRSWFFSQRGKNNRTTVILSPRIQYNFCFHAYF